MYSKIAIVSSGLGFLSFSNREIAAGAAYGIALGPAGVTKLNLSVDFAQLGLMFGTAAISSCRLMLTDSGRIQFVRGDTGVPQVVSLTTEISPGYPSIGVATGI